MSIFDDDLATNENALSAEGLIKFYLSEKINELINDFSKDISIGEMYNLGKSGMCDLISSFIKENHASIKHYLNQHIKHYVESVRSDVDYSESRLDDILLVKMFFQISYFKLEDCPFTDKSNADNRKYWFNWKKSKDLTFEVNINIHYKAKEV